MEYSLRLRNTESMTQQIPVLILILMEYSLRRYDDSEEHIQYASLNPYSNGI